MAARRARTWWRPQGRGLSVLQGEFLKDEVVTGLQEGGEGPTAPKKGSDVSEALVETADDVEDEGAIGDDFTEGTKFGGHLLEVPAVLGDGEVALDKVAKLCLKLDGAGLPDAEELGLDGEPGLPSGRTLGGDDFGEVVGECAENPRLHHAVHPCLVWREDRDVEVDVILKGELAEGQRKLTAPSIEVIGVDV